MALWSQPVVAYIDPTGGLPPSMWPVVLAPIFAAIAAALFAARLFAGRFLKRFGPVLIGAAVLLIVAGLLMFWLARKRGAETTKAGAVRVVVLGFDGLEPSLVKQYMAEGRMPNFSRLARQGVFHELRTTVPPQSPVAWASFITGAGPEKHGIADFIVRDPKTYKLDLSLADRTDMAVPWRGPAFWDDPAIQKAGATLLRVPLTFPPPKVNGRALSGMGVWDARGTEGTYFFYSTAPDVPDPRGIVSRLERDGGTLRSAIPGPYRVGEDDTVREPFDLAVKDDTAELRVQGKSYLLKEREWSDWISVEFRLGKLQLQKVATVTRAIWWRSGGETDLYVSPLNFDPARPLFPISCPPDYSAKLAEAIGTYHTRGMPYDTNGVSDGILTDDAFLAQCETILGENERMLAHELARFKGGLLVAYFEAPDAAQHMYWRAMDPEHPAYTKELAARYGRVIPECYARMDGVLGRTMAALGGRGAVVVLSDHGFAPFRRAVHLNSILRNMGYLALKEGRTSPELLKNVDWSRTRAYAVGFNSVYLNLAGREGEGIVRAEESAGLSVEIAGKLEAFEDGPSRAYPIKKVYVASDIYGKASGANMPDLIVGYARGYRASWQTSLGAAPEGLLEDNKKPWSGDHLMDAGDLPGVFLSSDRALDAHNIAEVGPAVAKYFGKSASNPK